jgi:hypothetical protein
MDIGNRLMHRAYVLVEAEVPTGEAIEDLVTLAHGDVTHLRSARHHATATSALPGPDPMSLEIAGFEPGLAHVARMRRSALGDLLDRAIASFGDAAA